VQTSWRAQRSSARRLALHGQISHGLATTGRTRIQRRRGDRLHSGGPADPFKDASGLTTRRYLTDKRGSIRDVADNIGDVLDHVVYGSFGQVVTETSAPDGDRFKYAAMQYDGGSIKVYYDRARSYDPSTGRFLQEDPLGLSGGDANVYRYVGNSPTNFTDPTGLREFPAEGGPGNWPGNGGQGAEQPDTDCCCCCCAEAGPAQTDPETLDKIQNFINSLGPPPPGSQLEPPPPKTHS
jgi:RHS repeat-associated protein